MTEITWLGHGSFRFRLEGGAVVLVDPWIDGNPKYPKEVHIDRCDAILCTHAHYDHSGGVLELTRRFDCPFVAIHELATYFASKGVKNVIGMNKGGTVKVAGLAATMTHALHSSSLQDGDRLVYGGEAAGYVFTFGDGRTAYFSGDTTVFSDMRLIADLYTPELVFLPIGDLYTMSPKEAAMACRMLRPKKVIPMHWGTFPPLTGRPEALREAISDLPQTEVWPLEPGKPVTW